MRRLLYPLLCALFITGQCAAQVINTIGGNGVAGYGGDGIAATSSQFNTPYGVAVDAAGNCYVADQLNNRIRKISPTGIVTTIAGTGTAGYTGDWGPATAATIYAPHGIAVDAIGSVYFSDYGNTVVRKINPAGIITTIAGTGFAGTGASGLPATAAQLNYPWGVAVDADFNVYIADQMNNRVCKVDPGTGIMTIFAGTMTIGFSGDGGQATAARFNTPTGVAVDPAGNVIIADYANNKVRKVNTSGIVNTIAGVGLPSFGYSGDGGPATAAQLYYPMTVATDAAGNVYICDKNNNCIRKIVTATGIISTIAGVDTAGFSGDGGPAIHAKLDAATGVAIRSNGDVYISDNNNNRIRRIKVTDAPFFTNGHTQSLIFCPTEFLSIDTFLKINDIDVGQTETWGVVQPPAHGSISVTYTATSTGGTITPSGLTFLPALGYIGPDSFKVSIFDGSAYDTTTIYVTVVGAPQAGTITGIDSVCPGLTKTLIDTVSGGVWSTGNSTVATVSAAGVVTGLTPGTATITYTVTNECGTAYTVFSMRVISTVPCVDAASSIIKPGGGSISLSPNPGHGTFSMSIPSDSHEDASVEIMNVAGQKIKEYRVPCNKEIKLNLDYPAGTYYVKAHTKNSDFVTALIINK